VGEPIVTLAEKPEEFELIDGRTLTPTMGEVILRDDEKILCTLTLGDAKATMITPETKNVLLVTWNAPGIEKEKVELALRKTVEYIEAYCNGKLEKLEVFE
jgi:DNA/RNA-binding domain of Phe-tRNA-synthetase-like protein